MLDRRAVPIDYEVLPSIPLPDGIERLTWATNIFIASDLSETRVSLSPNPAITITYNFNLRCRLAKTWLATLPTAGSLWMLPFFPYFSPGVVANGTLTINANVHYPYTRYLLTYHSDQLRYYGLSTTAGNSSDVVVFGYAEHPSGEVLVCPCFEAVLDKTVKYTNQGNVDGSTVSLTWRMAGQSEVDMTYHADSFDFVSAVQRPLTVDAQRKQVTFAPEPAPVHTYSPIAYKENQIPKTSASYFLNNYDREDSYNFRGKLMKGLGATTADHLLVADKLHRLQDDTVQINHNVRVSTASAVLREVTA